MCSGHWPGEADLQAGAVVKCAGSPGLSRYHRVPGMLVDEVNAM